MVSLIVGEKGKGKTKILLDRANTAVNEADGHIVYIDKSSKHMYELSNKIRLIDTSRYPLRNGDEFIGFILGIASQDYDLQQIYLDGFLKCTKVEDDMPKIVEYVKHLDEISNLCSVDFVISFSKNKEALDPELLPYIDVAL